MQFISSKPAVPNPHPQLDGAPPREYEKGVVLSTDKVLRAGSTGGLTRATLAVSLMNDPLEQQFFSGLTGKLMQRVSLGEEFIGLLADAISSPSAGTLGAGAVIKPVDGLTIEPAFNVIWTHVKTRWDYNNFVSALYGSKFDCDLFNTSLKAISYSPSIRVEYEVNLPGGCRLIPGVTYTHLWSYDLWSKSRFSDFSIDSGVLQSRLAASIPIVGDSVGRQVDLRPFVNRTDLYRAVRDSLEENLLWDFGADIAVQIRDSWIKETRLGGAYIYAMAFDGYRVNLGIEY